MEEETKVETETTENTAEVESETTENSEDTIDWKAKAEKAEELAKNYKIRAEKAEGVAKKAIPEPKTEGLNVTDVLYLSKANDLHQDDVPEVLEYAKKMGVSVQKAHEHYKPILVVRMEERKTAEVSNAGGGRSSTKKTSEAELLANAHQNIVPDSDAEIDRLMRSLVSQKKG